jgi:hypothetical protein
VGGPGSGSFYQWWRPSRKTTVEECPSIDANLCKRKGVLKAGVHLTGNWQWTYRRRTKCSIGYEVNTLDMGQPWMRLFYTRKGKGEPQQEDYRLRLTTTRPRFGGLRWWFICPLGGNGWACGRRVAKLYLPPGCRFFGCRHCYHLTYTSCQESHKHDGVYRHIAANLGKDVREIKRIMKLLEKRESF